MYLHKKVYKVVSCINRNVRLQLGRSAKLQFQCFIVLDVNVVLMVHRNANEKF